MYLILHMNCALTGECLCSYMYTYTHTCTLCVCTHAPCEHDDADRYLLMYKYTARVTFPVSPATVMSRQVPQGMQINLNM